MFCKQSFAAFEIDSLGSLVEILINFEINVIYLCFQQQKMTQSKSCHSNKPKNGKFFGFWS